MSALLAIRQRPASTAAALALVGATLGLAAGIVELTVGASIRPWIGDKHDPARLGVVTIVLSLIALAAAIAVLRQPRVEGGTRVVISAGLLIPAVIGFTTVGRLWLIPGPLLLASGIQTARASGADARAALAAVAHNWVAILAGALGCVMAALGMATLGVAGALGVVGGIAVVALVAGRRLLRGSTYLAGLLVATAPFAALTWWSVVTPALAATIISLGIAAPRCVSQVRPPHLRDAPQRD